MSRHRCARTGTGFTLVELLVVIGVVALIAALAFPAYQSILARSKSATCQANLRKIGLGMNLYANENNNRMPPHLETMILPGGTRIYPKWYAWIAPYITSWNGTDPVNTPMDKAFYCPANPRPYDPSLTYYGSVGKSDYSYGYNSRFLTSSKSSAFENQPPIPRPAVKFPAKFVLVTDIPNEINGTRSEAGLRQLPSNWIHPSALTVATRHSEGSNILFLDGHVELRKGSDILGSNYYGGNWSPYAQ